ncbi:XRE family transcriptional regulator [Paraburkholderia sp. Cpub6]|uniref:XRE family transcriptional regulator n=1 Tax=Paraburkholderia sp. Cpub6 TaxID=2723094 RepID=UPI00160E870D|nr:XRE family transcriptional regulator [Paraburkholderia sp. Cpub6]MBB5462909.1 phage repressor protein C with HTH and peptisase S24 domain/DNA-binding XRE family transcriptional regulator [Paraburkholderia sp. Cpub6]
MSELPIKYRFARPESKEKRDPNRLDFLYPPRMEMRNWIRSARKKADLTQEQLGEKLGVTKGNVSAWENGRHEPSYAQIQEISVVTRCPMPDTQPSIGSMSALDSKDVAERVQEMLTETGMDASAFAAKAAIPLERVEAWLKGAAISVEDAVAVQTAFGYNSAWVLARVGQKKAAIQYNDEFRPKGLGKRKRLAVIGMAQLGDNGFWADIEYPVGHGDGYIDWPTSDPDAYAIECSGDSMRPRIKHGEFVIVEPNHPIQPGEEVMVKSKDGRVMVKELAYKSAGRYTLLSINEAHGKITLNEDEIDKMHYVAGIAKRSMWRPD